MRRFNPEKELRKIQKGNKNKIIISVIAILLIIAIGSSYALYQIRYSKKIIYTTVQPFYSKDLQIAVYVNGEKKEEFPPKDDKYSYATYECEKDSKITFDKEEWSVTLTTNQQDKCNIYFVDSTQIHNFEFTGTEQSYEITKNGVYLFEAWGAQGGPGILGGIGGKGAYVRGNIKLEEGEKIYIYVGQNPTYIDHNCYGTNPNNSFNGSKIGSCSGGGGATDFRLENGEWDEFNSLKSRIMVAAGGGGAKYSVYGGYGGGLVGGDGYSTNPEYPQYTDGKGGTQSQYNFGYAKQSTSIAGNGYYSGESGPGRNAGGGSSFISGYPGCIAIDKESTKDNIITIDSPNHYSGKVFNNSEMIAGNATMPNPTGGVETGHSGDGYARITYIRPD